MSLDAIKAVVDLIEMGGVVGQEDIVKCLRSAIEQAERQEPVAWVCEGSASDEKHAIDYQQEDVDAIPIGTMLYTAPPQRQPLTDEEVRDLWSWAATAEAERTATTQQHAFARAVERKHGIGGKQ